MSQLVIIGASAMGREACSYAIESGMKVKGFLDSRPMILSGFVGYPPILGACDGYRIHEDDVFVCAVGEPEAKRRYAEFILGKGGRFVSVLHPTAYIGSNVVIGDGCIICPHVTITNDVRIGSHVIVNNNVSVSHDNIIGSYTTICPGCCLAGRVNIGEGVFIGTASTIIPDVSLGDNMYVAAGSVVVRSFASGRIMGVPAKLK